MFEAFLHGLGWCLGAVIALLIYIAVVPLIRKPREFDAERTNKRSIELLAERNDPSILNTKIASMKSEIETKKIDRSNNKVVLEILDVLAKYEPNSSDSLEILVSVVSMFVCAACEKEGIKEFCNNFAESIALTASHNYDRQQKGVNKARAERN